MEAHFDNCEPNAASEGDGRIDPRRVRGMLPARRIGRRIEHLEEIDSTNRYALDLPAADDVDGLVVVAERQSAGRGRLGRAWHCPRGAGVLCTVVLCDTAGAIDANLLSLIVPVALSDGIHDAAGVRAEIKWPNDLVTARGKLAGVLIESAKSDCGVRYAIGFGINCLQHRNHFPAELRGAATSLDLESPAAIDRHVVLAAVLQRLDEWLAGADGWDAAYVRQEWIRRALPLGGSMRLRHNRRVYCGVAIDIDPTAAIVVQLDEGGRRLFEVSSTTVLEYRT